MDMELYSQLLPAAVENGDIPRYLYKYRVIDDNLFKIIENNELWFSSPESFNDPFDCQIFIDANYSQIQLEEVIRATSKTKLSDGKIRDIAKQAISEPGKLEKILNDSFRKLINTHGICCFAKTEETTLLWSHYTECHTGVCLKFDVLADPLFFSVPLPVIYQKEYPYYNHSVNQRELANKLILTKSDSWSYEGEVRVIKFHPPGLHKFNKLSLVEIIFGCRSNEESIIQIKEAVKNNGYNHVTYRKAVCKKDEYGFDFINI
jgi:hypothetical protein